MPWLTAVSAPACWKFDVFGCKQHTRHQRCQHAHDAAEAGNSHLAERSAGSSFPSCCGYVSVDWCQGTASSSVLFVLCEVSGSLNNDIEWTVDIVSLSWHNWYRALVLCGVLTHITSSATNSISNKNVPCRFPGCKNMAHSISWLEVIKGRSNQGVVCFVSWGSLFCSSLFVNSYRYSRLACMYN